MNNWLFYLILLYLNLKSFTNISLKNDLNKNAEISYQTQQYTKAIEEYEALKSLSFSFEPEARLNLANAYFKINDTLNAVREYKGLLKIKNEQINTAALIQLGVLNSQSGDSAFALKLFKEALQNSPNNSFARYNYEFLKKKLPPPPQANNQTETEKEKEKEVSPDVTDEKKDELQSLDIERMSREKALQILESMKANEFQSIQQTKSTNKKKDFKDY